MLTVGYEWLSIAMFGVFFLMLLTGYPVSLSFAATAILFVAIGVPLGAMKFAVLGTLPSRWFDTMSNFTLLAIPFFIYLGAILEKSGLAEELLETVGILLGPLKGGMALAVVIVGTILAATTGVVAATIIAMGMITLPVMLKLGYNKKLATGVISASGTLAQMIPPSLVLVLLSDQLGVSVGDLFAGALIPGLMLSGSYAAYCVGIAYLRPGIAPAMPLEMRQITGRALARKVAKAIVPPIVLIFSVLGSIFFGIATPTEAGAVGAAGAVLLAGLNKRLNRKLLSEAASSTARSTALVIMILFCSTFFSLVFDQLGGRKFMTEILTNLPGGLIGFLIVANLVVFVLGIPLEFTEINFLVMPLLVPAARALGLEGEMMVWFGIVMAVNLQTAFISPPVGFSLFYLQSAAPKEVSTADIHLGAIPFVVIQVIVLLLVIIFPDTVTWLVRVAAK
ncbi:MAG: TRAP transporter large permease subunit [Roseiflexaceae bacterium]|nr:TRAP transporter large permease subunit [Roseiflexaceae bacterium]